FPKISQLLDPQSTLEINSAFFLKRLQIYVKKNEKLKSVQLLAFLKKIPRKTFSPFSEKDLLELRDLLRVFTRNKKWTAFDLYHMKVSLNLAVAMGILKRLVDRSDSKTLEI